jgi:ribonucleoside-diphosphate reductase, alpha subunit
MFTINDIKLICLGFNLKVDFPIIDQKFLQSRNLDEFCNSIMDDLLYPDNEKLAVILLVNQQHDKINVTSNDVQENIDNFLFTLEDLRDAGVVSNKFLKKVSSKISAIPEICHESDYNFSYISFLMLMKSYFCKIRGDILECPQYMYLRVAFQLHDEPHLIKQTYDLLREKEIIHASPTLFNSGTRNPQLSSCFLVCLEDDSIEGIFKTLKECALISKHGGGIGISLSNLRSKYSYIESSQNQCKGTKPVLNLLELCGQYVDQGGRRKGAICVYFEMTHPELPEILAFKRNSSRENVYGNTIRDLFLSLWIPDLFMKRVKSKGKWSFFDRENEKELTELYGEDYLKRYLELEEKKAYVRQIDAEELFNEILKTQVETGGPFMCYKDTANHLSNQKNVGTIKSSNLCTEIFEFSSEDEIAVCNLASLNLEKCVKNGSVDYDKIGSLTRILTRNLNKAIDNNYYCSEYSKKNNLELRPIGIGITGLQGLFFQLGLPMTSKEAREVNVRISETLYYNALLESNKIAIERTSLLARIFISIPYVKFFSGCYSKFWGSPLSEGKTHVELFEELSGRKIKKYISEDKWNTLKESIKRYGIYNSLLIALMPTVSTAELVDATDCFEPVSEAVVYKTNQHGTFRRVNKYFRKLLTDKGEWNQHNIDSITEHNGSIQHFDFLTDHEKLVFRTAWEIDVEDYIKLAIDRAPFIDQSQSLSWFIENPGKDFDKLGRLHFYTWENKLPTGMYYLRQVPISQTSEFKKLDSDMKHCISCS